VPEWPEAVATFLDRLPVVYAALLPAAVLIGLAWAEPFESGPASFAGFSLSLWMTLLFGTCVCHELIHRRDRKQALLGHLLAGFCGYHALGAEHLAHHARPGDTRRAEYPRKGESVWSFAVRRTMRVSRELFGRAAPVWSRQTSTPTSRGIRLALAATVLTWASFAVIGGISGACLYLVEIAGVMFGIQLITYIQHWGLGDDAIADRVSYGRGWEDDCRFQAWVTLGISLHDQHHRDSRRPYYRIDLSPDSPRLPAGYVLLMFASLVPAIWRRVMTPAFQHWLATPASPVSAGRRLTCFGLHRVDATAMSQVV
jgi:alkane 1-monooxygenase